MKKFLQSRWVHLLYIVAFILVYPLSIFVSYTIGQAVGEHKLESLIEGNISHVYQSDTPKSISNTQEVDFTYFWKTWELLDRKFVHSTATTTTVVKDQEKVWAAIQGLTAAYDDPYTVFFPPEEKKLFDEDIQGEFSGAGIEIGIRNGFLTVISPLSGTPASKAGIKAKDIISKIEDVDSSRISPGAAAKLIRGEKGTPVVLTVLREGENEPLEITVIRDTIVVPTIKSEINNGVYIFYKQLLILPHGLYRREKRLLQKHLKGSQKTGFMYHKGRVTS